MGCLMRYFHYSLAWHHCLDILNSKTVSSSNSIKKTGGSMTQMISFSLPCPQASHQPSEWCIRFAQMCRCVFTNRHKAILLALRQLDMLDRKDEKTTNRLDCSTASMLPSSDYTSCCRTDRDPVPVTVLSSRRSEAMSSTKSCAVGELHKMVNYFGDNHFW